MFLTRTSCCKIIMHMATVMPDQGEWFQSEISPKMFVEEMKRKHGRRAGNLEQVRDV